MCLNHHQRSFRSITTAFAAVLAAVAMSAVAPQGTQAAQIFGVTFDSQTGTGNNATINGVTGGSATIYSNGYQPGNESTDVVTTTPDMGGGGYLHTAISDNTNGQYLKQGATLTPDAGHGLNAISSNNGQALNGAFDFFFHTDNAGRDFGPISTGDSSTGIQLSVGSGTTAAAFLSLNSGSQSLFSNITNVKQSDGSYAGKLWIGKAATSSMTADTVYHIAASFSTDANDLVTAKFFFAQGNVAIDTSSDTDLAGEVTFKINAANNGLNSGAFTLGHFGGGGEAVAQDYDNFRIYDSTPTTFTANAVPEPASLILVALGAACLLGRRRHGELDA